MDEEEAMKGTILLAIDHSKVASRAAELVADIAVVEHNPVVVLHVHQTAVGRFGEIMIEREPEDGCIANALADELREAGVDAKAESVKSATGSVAARIVHFADAMDAGLIVMGTHSESDVASIALGSVSHRVLHHAHRPVLMVPAT